MKLGKGRMATPVWDTITALTKGGSSGICLS